MAGAKDRVTKRVSVRVIANGRGKTLQRFVFDEEPIVIRSQDGLMPTVDDFMATAFRPMRAVEDPNA